MNSLYDNLYHSFKKEAPYQWDSIKKEIVKQLAHNLLKSLEEFSDPHGKELIDLRDSYIINYKKGA